VWKRVWKKKKGYEFMLGHLNPRETKTQDSLKHSWQVAPVNFKRNSNFCAKSYLGLCNEVIDLYKSTIAGTSSRSSIPETA